MGNSELPEYVVSRPGELFVHEAGHALAYDVIGVHVKSCSVFTNSLNGMDEGSTKVDTDGPAPTIGELSLMLMSGPAAHLYIAHREFEHVINRFFTDFTTLIRKFPQVFAISDLHIARILANLRFVLEGPCRGCVERHRHAILRFAGALQASPISANSHELSGESLDQAIAEAWQGAKPSPSEIAKLVETKIFPIITGKEEIPVEWMPWIEYFTSRVRLEIPRK